MVRNIASDVDGAPGAISGGVAGIGQLPSFALPAAGGGEVRTWDFKARAALLLWLADAGPTDRALERVAAREPEVRREGAELVVIVRAPLDRVEAVRGRTRLAGPFLADADGRVHRLLGARQPTLLVVDRNGTLYWRAPILDDAPDVDEALSWLEYLNILEPECGTCVPAWPVDETFGS